MAVLLHHLASLARLLFASLPLEIPTQFAPSEMRQRLATLPLTSGLTVTWEGPDAFVLESGTSAAPYRGAAIAPVVQFRLVERDGQAVLEGAAALPGFPRGVLLIVMAAFLLFAFGVLIGTVPTDQPLQALPVIGLALSMLEIVHLAVLRSVRTTLQKLYQTLDRRLI